MSKIKNYGDIPECFWPFMGNNSEIIKVIHRPSGGGVSFKEHLGKPLTQSLWNTLMYLGCYQFSIYGPLDEENTARPIGTNAIIYLDAANNVTDIIYYR